MGSAKPDRTGNRAKTGLASLGIWLPPRTSLIVRARSGRIVAKPSGVWETGGMKKPELTDMAWLGPKEEMDRASHRFGKCSECHEIICVEKAVTDGPSTQGKTSEMLTKRFAHTLS